MKTAYRLWILLLLPVLLCSCAAPAVPGTETVLSGDVAATDTTDSVSASSTNKGPSWARTDDTYYPPVVTPAEKLATLGKYYSGQWYLQDYPDVSFTVSYDGTTLYFAAFNYSFDPDAVYPLYAMIRGEKNFMLEITGDNLESVTEQYGLVFEGTCITLNGRVFCRGRALRKTAAECFALAEPYAGRWFLESDRNVYVDLTANSQCLSIAATNFSLRDRLTFWDENAFRLYPHENGVMGWISAVTVSYAEWEQELAIQHLFLGENAIVIGGHTFIR